MLQIVGPLADVLVAAGKDLRAFALHFPGQEVALISSLVRPDHHALALHLIALKFALVELASL